jgi:hypothetical protein
MFHPSIGRLLTLAGCAAVFGGVSAHAQNIFTDPNFSSTSGLALNGVAVQTGSTLSITPPVRAAAGSMWYGNRVPVGGFWFSTFEFRIRDIAGSGADGFAFVIQNSADGTAALGNGGGALGYAANPVFPNLPGITNSLAIEFDLWNNTGDWGDFTTNQHISVQCRGLLENSPDGQYSMGSTLLGPDLSDGLVHTGQIQYLNGALNVFVDLNQLLSVNVNLSNELTLDNGNGFVGLTASTGAFANVERHELLSWDFNVIPNPASGAMLTMAGVGLLGLRRARPGR